MVNDLIQICLQLITAILWYQLGKYNAKNKMQMSEYKKIIDEIDLSIELAKELKSLAAENNELLARVAKYEKLDDAEKT